MNNFDRSIDDAGLNQDSTFDIKYNENFDVSDDFHKYDDTSQQESEKSSESKIEDKEYQKEKRRNNKILNTPSQFDGHIAI